MNSDNKMIFEQVNYGDLRNGDIVRIFNSEENRIEFHELVIKDEEYWFKEDESKRIYLYKLDKNRLNSPEQTIVYFRIPNKSLPANSDTISNVKKRQYNYYLNTTKKIYKNYDDFEDEDRPF